MKCWPLSDQVISLRKGDITPVVAEENYLRIKDEVAAIIETEMERIYDTPELAHLLVAKEE